jgi:hypothetical protein
MDREKLKADAIMKILRPEIVGTKGENAQFVNGFDRGFDAGYEANRWVAIESGLPKEDGYYLTCVPRNTNGSGVRQCLTYFAANDDMSVKYWRETVIAYMPIPPYTVEKEAS